MEKQINILMIYPKFPNTFWGMNYLLPLLGKKAMMPPLGLLTIAAMFPPSFNFKLIDLNVEPLNDTEIEWADTIFFSAMLSQEEHLFELSERCQKFSKTIVFGGPYPTANPEQCAPYCDVIVKGEIENIVENFVNDYLNNSLKPCYEAKDKPDLSLIPAPRFGLLNINHYFMLPVQFSRGCPFNCEFCDIIVLFGRIARTKSSQQMLNELETIYNTGYRGEIFIVDDNFIGNKRDVKKLLPHIIAWNNAKKNPFSFGTEASLDLARDKKLLDLMKSSRFRWVFLGIETPSKESLTETKKFQNLREPMEKSVRTIMSAGLQVYAGFIIGFDSDKSDIFERQINFIEEAAIPLAAVGLLMALPGTPLHARLKKEGRIKKETTSAIGFFNIKTVLPETELLEGYTQILRNIYEPKAFFNRSYNALIRLPRPKSFLEGIKQLSDTLRMGIRVVSNNEDFFRFFIFIQILIRLYKNLSTEMKNETFKMFFRLLLKRPDLLGNIMETAALCLQFYKFSFNDCIPISQKRIEERIKLDILSDSCREETVLVQKNSA